MSEGDALIHFFENSLTRWNLLEGYCGKEKRYFDW